MSEPHPKGKSADTSDTSQNYPEPILLVVHIDGKCDLDALLPIINGEKSLTLVIEPKPPGADPADSNEEQ